MAPAVEIWGAPLAIIAWLFLWKATIGMAQDSAFDVLQYINPLIGSTNGGNVFAGATRPYGLGKPVANVDGANTGGFAMDDSNITGFSSVHDSGTGGNPSLGNFPLFPQMVRGKTSLVLGLFIFIVYLD